LRDPKERVPDILDAIAAIERHPGRDKAAFDTDIVWEAATCQPSNPRWSGF
jgi:hypothetical protein